MQVSVENSSGLERRITVQIPESEIQEKVDTKLQELSKQVQIKGFRPGRVPMSVIRQRYGKQVRLEVANESMQSSLQQAIQDEKLRPASMPEVTEAPEGVEKGDLQFTAVIEVYPEFDQLDVSELAIEKPDAEVSDDDIDEMLGTLREQRRSWEPVERKPGEGDQVLFEYVATTEEGRVPEEGHQRLAIIMGASGFDGLETSLAQLAADEESEADLEFPENFREAELAGKKAKVELKITSVAEMNMPEIDEEFIKSFGIDDGTEASLRVEIKSNLERELKQASTSLLKVNIIDGLVNTMPDLEVPESIVRQEAASLAARAASQEGREPDPEETAAFMGKAAERVRGGLLLGELARQNQIRVDGGKVRESIDTIAQTYEDPSEVVQLYYGNQQLLAQVENAVMEEQVVDWVMENAKVSPREMKFQEVISSAANANQ
jgi:trigger factor